MKLAGLGLSVFAATLAAFVLLVVFAGGTDAPGDEAAVAPTATIAANLASPEPTAAPSTWLEALGERADAPAPFLVSCADSNGDVLLDDADDPALVPRGFSIALDPALACVDPEQHADFYPGTPFSSEALACDGTSPLMVVLAASAGSDLLQPREGESLGLIEIAKGIRSRLEGSGHEVSITVAVAAIFGAQMPQTSMERWLTAHIDDTLEASPCARAVVIGHSHGGVTATAIGVALEPEYADRLLVVLIDRTDVLYDRVAEEMPQRVHIINFFQLNEGWHGEPIDQPNVENVDESDERAPIAPSDGGGGAAIVSHKTLDDAPAVQQGVVERVVAWAGPM